MKRFPERSVRADWVAKLAADKDTLFRAAEKRWEERYRMLSVSLDEALLLCQRGHLLRARAMAGMCDELFQDLAARLEESLYALEAHARHYGTQPAVAALDAGFFRGEASRHAAGWSNLLHHVLFAGRLRWFHKLSTLREILDDLASEFHAATSELREGTTLEPARLWESLDTIHFDLNTCLRETIVMLKCFLQAMHPPELTPFQRILDYEAAARPSLGTLPLVRTDG